MTTRIVPDNGYALAEQRILTRFREECGAKLAEWAGRDPPGMSKYKPLEAVGWL